MNVVEDVKRSAKGVSKKYTSKDDKLKEISKKAIEKNTKKMLEVAKKHEQNKPKLTPYNFNDFLNREDNKKYYVKNMFAIGTINMIYSPPASMKSFLSYYLGLCLATGKEFLNQPTKKVNVGYFDWENPLSDIQNRVKGICKGHNIDTKTINNFYFFAKQPTLMSNSNNYSSQVNEDLKEQLIEFVNDNDIKVLFLDTLRRLGNFDENDSKAINSIKSELLDPLVNECNTCIILLHHTSKNSENYRGSVDIEGILDTSFFIKKNESNESIELQITNKKRRNNELEKLACVVEIENEEYKDKDGDMLERIIDVKFSKTEYKEKQETDYKEIREYFITNLELERQYKNKELQEMISFNFGYTSNPTLNKIIKWFVDINLLQSFGERKSKYYIINPTHKTKDKNIIEEKIYDSIVALFKDNDTLNLNDLKEKFEEESLNKIVKELNDLGVINTAKKDYITKTAKFDILIDRKEVNKE